MSGQTVARRKGNSYKTILLTVAMLELFIGIVSLAMGLAAGHGYRERLVQGISTIIFLSGLVEFELHEAKTTVAYGSSAFAASVSTIASSVGAVMEFYFMYTSCSTLSGFHVGILLFMLYGTVASIVHMANCIAAIRAAYTRTRGRSDRGNAEVCRFTTGRRWIVDRLCSWANLDGTRARIQIISLEDKSRIGDILRADDATISCDLETHVKVSYDPEKPPCYDEITKTPPP